MPAGRPKKIVSIVENVVEANPNSFIGLQGATEFDLEVENIKKEDSKVSYEFEKDGKKYRKSFDEKGNSLGAMEI